MKSRIWMFLAALMAATSPAKGENPTPRPAAAPVTIAAPEKTAVSTASVPDACAATCPGGHDPCCWCEPPCGPLGRLWVRAEYLSWRTSGQRLPPLLTTSPAGTAFPDAGVLGRPGTTVVFGNSTVDDDVRSGGRFTLGYWLDSCQTTGIEATVFSLEDEGTTFSISSPGTPILARPFINAQTGLNSSLKVAFPGLVRGSFTAETSSELRGAEINLRQNICCGCDHRVDVLVGYRYLRLRDRLRISETEIGTDPEDPLVGLPFVINEQFGSSNEFHGGQLGLLAEFRRCAFFVQLTGKVALGSTSRRVKINGVTQFNDNAPELGGFLALPTNIGGYHSSQFSVVPEVGINVGYDLTERVRVFAGYTVLYWSNVVRAGEQVDLAVNISQPPLGDALVGPARPAFSSRDTDFWAHGLNFGIEFRY